MLLNQKETHDRRVQSASFTVARRPFGWLFLLFFVPYILIKRPDVTQTVDIKLVRCFTPPSKGRRASYSNGWFVQQRRVHVSNCDRRGTRVVWNEVTGQFQQVFVVFFICTSRPWYCSDGRTTALFSLAGFACYTHGANLMLLVMRSMRPTKKETKLLVTLTTSKSIYSSTPGPAASSSSSLSPVCSSSYNLSFPAFSLFFRHAPPFYYVSFPILYWKDLIMSLESDSSPCVCVDNASQIKQKQKIMHKSSGPRLGYVTHLYVCINAI